MFASVFATTVLMISAVTTPVNIIFDTDLDTDVDDVGALAVLHGLENLGEAKLLGVIHSAPNVEGVDAIRLINRWYGRPDIPVGWTDWTGALVSPYRASYAKGQERLKKAGRYYAPVLAQAYRESLAQAPKKAESGALVYRRILAAQQDGSVVICAVGQVPALASLLDTKADAISALSGKELVEKKVRLLVMMARGDFPKGADTFNWKCHKPAAAKVIQDWPGAFAVMPHGQSILTGPRLLREGTQENPCRQAYEIYVVNGSRSSWDLCAAYYAVRRNTPLFRDKVGYRLEFDAETGKHQWLEDPAGKHIFLEQVKSDSEIVEALEELMVIPPKKTQP